MERAQKFIPMTRPYPDLAWVVFPIGWSKFSRIWKHCHQYGNSSLRSQKPVVVSRNVGFFSQATDTVFIWICDQLRVSAHLHPTPSPSHSNSNKCQPLPYPPSPSTPPPPPKKWISTNGRLLRKRSFLQSIYRSLALLHFRILLLPFIVLLRNKHTTC